MTTRLVSSVVSLQVSSWSVLDERWRSGATKAHKRCMLHVTLATARELIMSSVYQEYLAKSLTEKYNHLNVQMDRLVNEANSELEMVNQRLSGKCLVPSASFTIEMVSSLHHIVSHGFHRYQSRE